MSSNLTTTVSVADDRNDLHVSNEESPLLYVDDLEHSTPCQPPVTPLPKAQLLALCLARLAEPIAYTQVKYFIHQ